MKHRVHLTGGGPGAFLALRRHFKAAVAELELDRTAVVAYVGTASNDNAGFFTMIRTALGTGPHSPKLKLAKIASKSAKMSDAKTLLETCDLVFVSGGDVEHGMKVLHDRDMVKPLQGLAKAGKPMFGISAGSLMLAREWVRFPDDDAEQAELFPCLGIAPLHADAHAEADNWDELRVLVDLLRRRGDSEQVGYGLTRKGGLSLEIDDRGARIRAIGTDIPRIGVKRGKVVDLAPLAH